MNKITKYECHLSTETNKVAGSAIDPATLTQTTTTMQQFYARESDRKYFPKVLFPVLIQQVFPATIASSGEQTEELFQKTVRGKLRNLSKLIRVHKYSGEKAWNGF